MRKAPGIVQNTLGEAHKKLIRIARYALGKFKRCEVPSSDIRQCLQCIDGWETWLYLRRGGFAKGSKALARVVQTHELSQYMHTAVAIRRRACRRSM
jgi:hypothetical protein